MIKLSIEEKAKRYDEAIKKAKNTIEVNQTIPDIVECVESLFPELKEPEDERIRKEIIAFLTYYHTGQGNSVKYDDDWIAWLEKQGEQNPAWSEEEVEIIDWLVVSFDCLKIPTDIFYQSKVRPFLILLRNKIQPLQPKQEWSEEDKAILEKCIGAVKVSCYSYSFKSEAENWLKSLRPQSHWKPSEEQMDVLAKMCSTLHLTSDENEIMESIYDALKKLKG